MSRNVAPNTRHSETTNATASTATDADMQLQQRRTTETCNASPGPAAHPEELELSSEGVTPSIVASRGGPARRPPSDTKDDFDVSSQKRRSDSFDASSVDDHGHESTNNRPEARAASPGLTSKRQTDVDVVGAPPKAPPEKGAPTRGSVGSESSDASSVACGSGLEGNPLNDGRALESSEGSSDDSDVVSEDSSNSENEEVDEMDVCFVCKEVGGASWFANLCSSSHCFPTSSQRKILHHRRVGPV